MSAKEGEIHRRLLALLKEHPEGLTSGQMRDKLGLPADEQAQLERRRRDLYVNHEIVKKQVGRDTIYVYKGPRPESKSVRSVNSRVRAAVLRNAKGSCQMCGRTVADDHIKLVVDHKIPLDWGGSNDEDNLWALCEECNSGKKAHFASQDQATMRAVMKHDSVHVRIGELLKLNIDKPVPGKLIEFVANREDWSKRTRELRYLGWKIAVATQRQPNGKVESFYTLRSFSAWPEDPTKWIQRYERSRSASSQGGSR